MTHSSTARSVTPTLANERITRIMAAPYSPLGRRWRPLRSDLWLHAVDMDRLLGRHVPGDPDVLAGQNRRERLDGHIVRQLAAQELGCTVELHAVGLVRLIRCEPEVNEQVVVDPGRRGGHRRCFQLDLLVDLLVHALECGLSDLRLDLRHLALLVFHDDSFLRLKIKPETVSYT